MSFSNPQETGRPITLKDEGVPLTNNLASLDLRGSGVSSSAVGQSITSTIAGGGGAAAEAFETVAKNLLSYPYALNFSGSVLNTIVYTVGAGSITKTFNYTNGKLTSIVLSGDTPEGIYLTKTLTYTGENLTSVTYS